MATAIDPTGAAISWAIVRFRGFDLSNCPALKSCIKASEVTAIVPVSPLEDILTGTLPGEMNAKTACIIFDIALIGPQFVSPSTRKPTSISGRDSNIAMNERYTGIPMLKYWTRQITTAITIEPIATHCIGKSACSIWLPLSPRKVLTIKFHFNAIEVSPPATIKPVAGHITQSTVIGNVCSEIIPCDRRKGGRINQLTAVPMAIAKQIRNPTSNPEPNDSRLKLKPIFIGCMPGRNQVSLIHLK